VYACGVTPDWHVFKQLRPAIGFVSLCFYLRCARSITFAQKDNGLRTLKYLTLFHSSVKAFQISRKNPFHAPEISFLGRLSSRGIPEITRITVTLWDLFRRVNAQGASCQKL